MTQDLHFVTKSKTLITPADCPLSLRIEIISSIKMSNPSMLGFKGWVNAVGLFTDLHG